MNESWRRRLAALLAIVMLVSLVPTVALAAERVEEAPALAWDGTAAEPFSLLPLEEKRLSVDFGKTNPLLLQNVKVSDLLAEDIRDAQHPDRPLTGTEKVAWWFDNGTLSRVADLNSATVDVDLDYIYNGSGGSRTIEMVVGSGKQLDMNNKRYLVRVSADYTDWLVPTLYKQTEDGTRTAVEIKDTVLYNDYLDITVSGKALSDDDKVYLGLHFADAYQLDGYQVVVARQGGETTSDVTDMIWEPDWTQEGAGFEIDPNRYVSFEIKLFKDGQEIGTRELSVWMNTTYTGVSYDNGLYDESGKDVSYSYSMGQDATTGAWGPAYTLYSEYKADREYYQRLSLFDDGVHIAPTDSKFADLVAVKGYYETADAANAAIAAGKAANISKELFGLGKGYKSNYSKTVIFSIFYGDLVDYISVRAETGSRSEKEDMETEEPGNDDTTFILHGVSEYAVESDTALKSFIVPREHDNYYGLGYQTALVLKEDLDASKLKLDFYTDKGTKIYAGTPLVEQTSGESVMDFSKGLVQYTASAENGKDSKNYYVTVVGKESHGPSLFINGANGPKEKDGTIRRELFLDSYYGRVHDIFLANIGSEAMSDLKVELSGAQNVKLDEYWTVGGEGNDTLAPFTSVRNYLLYGSYLDNIAKIRLVPDGEGEIRGKLSITYGVGQDTMVFTLTGQAGDPKITTTEIPVGVKYVPYGTVIQNSNTYDWNKVDYTLQSGKLPKGVSLMPNGELYGVPQETGKFTFRVRMKNSYASFPNSYGTFTLEVQDNTAENVANQTDAGYEMSGLPDKMSTYTAQTFKSEGEMGEFIALWLDGKKLVEGEDYEKSEGSTVITADSKLFRDAGRGNHTMAFEFRVNGDVTKDLKKAAQNYTVTGSSSSGSSTRRPSNRGEAGTTTPVKEFIDVAKDAWFYDEVQWAVKNNAMIGTSENTFAPYARISQAMVTTVMARMAGVDLSKYADVTGTNLLSDQWYTNASVWAWQGGIVGDGSFSALEPITRGDLAVMLMRYLSYRSVPCPKPATPAEFADAAAMTPEENDAFQALYAAGILKGVGENYMAPDRSTSRVELAIIAHRLSDYFAKH